MTVWLYGCVVPWVAQAAVCKKGKTPLWPQGKARKNEEFKPKTEKACSEFERMPCTEFERMPCTEFERMPGR